MKKVNFFIPLFILLFIISCKNDGILSDSEIENVKKEIIEKGDKDSYSRLMIYYEENNEYELIMPYSIVMAYKYQDADAYYDIYKSTIRLNNQGKFDYTLIKKLNKESRKLALDNLIRSSELGDIDAKVWLVKYYKEGTYLPKNR